MLQDSLLVIVAGAIAWLLVRMLPKREETGTSAYRRSTAASPFHGVSVYPYSNCCQHAKAVNGKRFLSSEAPHLPLEGCEAQVCHCVYRHHADRRTGTGNRRTIDIEGDVLLHHGGRNCRSGVGRREIDKSSDLSWT
jgi:hypothetical protein